MIHINLVRVGDMLIGRTVSDRWNLIQLGIDQSFAADRNHATLKSARRLWGNDFMFSVVRNDSVHWEASENEKNALGDAVLKISA